VTLGGKVAQRDYAEVWFEEKEVPVLLIGSMVSSRKILKDVDFLTKINPVLWEK
jgi:hypothetical protein